ncbi:hypothetical protein [Falsiroseomonas selenitidurans]|uniref:Uncharacterized protein n=1 Tax=Falsiroseomonas selenitidurans TaxID=2716335 RepID=A0ABX1EAI5_9PROT|nr:hypothetical protein [Falsiroseomonas selenitidurans]NKC34259.1 hypothetical protein [Falsiroseomonas selenitidurans]
MPAAPCEPPLRLRFVERSRWLACTRRSGPPVMGSGGSEALAGLARQKADAPEEIVAKRRQAAVPIGRGSMVAAAVRPIGAAEPTDNRCRMEDGGPKPNRVKRLKAMEPASAR